MMFFIMAVFLAFQICLGPSDPPRKVIDLTIYSENQTKFGEKLPKDIRFDNSSVIGNVIETLTNKVKVDETPTVIELPLKIVKKDLPKPEVPVPEPVVETPKPKPPKPSSNMD
jgi:phosphoribosylformylglycinamidine (FGAM) synthase-like enzyme